MGLFVRKRLDGSVQVAADRDFTTPPPARHRFAQRWVNRHIMDGVVIIGDGKITVGGAQYRILRSPGAYCDYCGDKIGEGPARTAEEAQLRQAFIGTCQKASRKSVAKSNNPAGYQVIHYYDAELIEE